MKQGKATTVQDHSGKFLTEERQILNRFCSELYNYKANGNPSVLNCPQTHTHRGRPPHPSQRSVGCSTIIEEREVSWSRQHPSRAGPSGWRGCNHWCHDNLQQDLADRRTANPVDPVLSHHTSQARQPAAVPELPNDQPHQPHKQSHAEDITHDMTRMCGCDEPKVVWQDRVVDMIGQTCGRGEAEVWT